MTITELERHYNHWTSGMEVSEDVKKDIWSMLLDIELHRMSEEVTILENDFLRKKNQLNVIESYYDSVERTGNE